MQVGIIQINQIKNEKIRSILVLIERQIATCMKVLFVNLPALELALTMVGFLSLAAC